MKKATLIIALYFPLMLNAQRVVTLSINQPPEFGFSISKQDTTIVKGNTIVLGKDISILGGTGEFKYNWSPGDALNDSTTLNPIGKPMDTTEYVLTVTDKLGCSFSVFYTVNVTNDIVNVGNKPHKNFYEAIIFPNPCGEEFNVRISGPPYESVRLEIIDINGKLIWQNIINIFQSEITETIKRQFKKGTYSLLITTEKEIISRKFIVR
ncbi:MAG TPA: T9SS type A sorting domain-containing protein [Bacteroidales bacterium]|nr:T9SS type A sorting domain-containing protein [Bacteroidales bacterium]